ncbi:hypothetical protein [Vibrio chagasii]|uniref:hypothetical protein n=1 Tax=Vibrio chagasii TaxID=170679 RepID=UPI003DA0A537
MDNSFDFELAELLRKYVPHDESIHSTLLRTLFAYDPNIKPIGVIGNSGFWVDDPFVPKEYQHLFYRYPDHVLLEMIDMGLSVSGKDNSLFDNPAYYTYRISSTFFSGRRTRERAKSTKKIRYCLSCIAESIDSVGYGYFRHFWERSNICLIHGQPLKEIPELGFSKTLKAVKRLLNAKECKQAITLDPKPRNISNSRFKRTWNETGKYLFPIKFAPGCLMPVFAKWALRNCSRFENVELRNFSHQVTGQYLNFFHLYEFDYRRDFAGILMLCAEYEPELLHSFMINEVSLIGLELGPRKQGILREIFAKHSGSDCNTCSEKSCIMKTHQGIFSVDVTKLNFKNLFESSYTMARISMQGRPIRTSESSVWGAIDVSPKVVDSKAFKKVEFQLNKICHK